MRFPGSILKQCRFLAGPTASGKTAVGIRIAEQISAEIISLDSMTVFRGMDIGTAKPTAAERARAPHHLLDIRHPGEEFSTAEFIAAALTACEEILSRGRIPLFIGGTGLYLRSLLRGVFEGPSANWELRRQWELYARQQGAIALHAQLAAIDPATAQRLHPHDQRRVIRALEIQALTGRTASESHQEQPLPLEERPRYVHWLNPPRDILHQRIDSRVDQMLADGLVQEVDQLRQAPEGLGRTARQALGYKEILAHQEAGVPLADAVRELKTRTRQFAKRQCTWFRNLEELTPIDIAGTEPAESVAAQVLAVWNSVS
ncbi:MAG: tRNA (adenosine(37)-N6)-dimethylallyltransferase MiaA [Planctomycetota bacterium]|nr:MAG: tRNA (adenosine(37)-N6)-dimethylallyltransferase MiaA [Planctomycetota bacterium]